MLRIAAWILIFLIIIFSPPNTHANPVSLKPFTFWNAHPEANGTFFTLNVNFSGNNAPPTTVNLYANGPMVFLDGDTKIGELKPRFQLSHYRFYKVSLRDDQREEIVGIDIGGQIDALGDLFIAGLNTQGELAFLPLRSKGGKRLFYVAVSPAVLLEGRKLVIPFANGYDTRITVAWNEEEQSFIFEDNLSKIPEKQPVPAPRVLTGDDLTIGQASLGQPFFGKDPIYHVRTMEYSYRSGGMETRAYKGILHIHLITVDGPGIPTRRGVSVGDPAYLIVDKYGDPYKTESGNLIFYEYAAIDKPEIILKFAIGKDSGVIEYIKLSRW